MITTIDSAGRIVVPKAIREAMGLTPGTAIDVVLTDGRIEIDFAPVDATVDVDDGLPRVLTSPAAEPLTDDDVRATLESARR